MEIFTPTETIVRSSPFSTFKWGKGMVNKTQTKYIFIYFFLDPKNQGRLEELRLRTQLLYYSYS